MRITLGTLPVGACELARARFGLLLALTILGGCYKVVRSTIRLPVHDRAEKFLPNCRCH
jgi:hypothetical protein